jgi:hypothetical protein
MIYWHRSDARTRRSLFNEIRILILKCIVVKYMHIIKVRKYDAYEPVYRYGIFERVLSE